MISIHKPAAAPEILLTRGREETGRNQEAYERAPADHDRGASKLSFRSDIYGHSSVKEALIAAQHGKCCFCEAKITHISYGDVEHFRPKAGYRQHPRDPLGRPGYYWLAYDWGNPLGLKNVVRLLPDEPEGREALAILNDAIRDNAEYAAMARCLMARKP